MHPNPIPTTTPPAEPASPTMAAILANARADADRAHQMHDEASDLVDRLYADRRQLRRTLGQLADRMDERANAAYSPADGQALADFADEVRALRESIPGPDDSPTGRGGLLAAVRAVIAAGYLDPADGGDVELAQGEAHARLVAAYEAVAGETADTTPATDPRRIAYELVLAGVAAGLPIPDSISIPSNNKVFDLRMADGDRDAVERWAAYLNLPTPADGDPPVVEPGHTFRNYAAETWKHPAMPDYRRVQIASFCALSDAEAAELESQQGGTR